MGNFTVPNSMCSLVDDRPLINVVVDVHETMSLLTAGLMEIAPNRMIDDATVGYIGALIVNSVASPWPQNRAMNQVSAFFPGENKEQIEKLVDEVKESFSEELHRTEMSTEILLGKNIYPAAELPAVQSAVGQMVTLPYRLGKLPDDPLIDNSDLGYSKEELELIEESEDEACESIIHLD